MMTVSSPEEISALFADAHNEFLAIIGKPSDDDVHCLCRHNLTALQDIDLGGNTNATVLILPEADHKAANGNQVFDRADRALKTYNSSIQDDDNNAVRLHQNKTWSHKHDCQAEIRSANRVGNKFVLSGVEKIWVIRLKNETTLFKHVTLRNLCDLRNHLGATSMGREAIDMIGIQQGILSWWVKYLRVP